MDNTNKVTALIQIFRELGMNDKEIGEQLESVVEKPTTTRFPGNAHLIGKKHYGQVQISKRKRRP
jgi:hypothetical protein